MAERYRVRREKALDLLGRKCVHCGSSEDLQFDHVDPATKSFTIAKIWTHSETKFWEEIKKCQLLCQRCHTLKTLKDLGQGSAKEKHGTLSSYRYCKCDECRRAKSIWYAIWLGKNGEERNRKRREKRKHSSNGQSANDS